MPPLPRGGFESPASGEKVLIKVPKKVIILKSTEESTQKCTQKSAQVKKLWTTPWHDNQGGERSFARGLGEQLVLASYQTIYRGGEEGDILYLRHMRLELRPNLMFL